MERLKDYSGRESMIPLTYDGAHNYGFRVAPPTDFSKPLLFSALILMPLQGVSQTMSLT